MGPPRHVLLLIEDDAPLRRSLVLTLTDEGFDVIEGQNGEQGLHQLSRTPDAVLLDLGLPDTDGFELCALLRERTSAPIMVVSARRATTDLAQALAAGADDYLIKPFPAGDLAQRVRGLLQVTPDAAWSLGALHRSVDGSISWDGQQVALTRTELRLLSELAVSPGRAVDRRVLAQQVWGVVPAAGLLALDARVLSLRRKLDRLPGSSSTGETSTSTTSISDDGTGYVLHA